MKQNLIFFCLGIFTILVCFSTHLSAQQASEAKVIEIKLSGEVNTPTTEVSGMTWYGDNLIILPQYPEDFNNSVYTLSRKSIGDYITAFKKGGNPKALEPKPIPFKSQYFGIVDGYEGFESIAIDEETGQLWLTIEVEPEGCPIYSFVVSGQIEKDLSAINVDNINHQQPKLQRVPGQSGMPNMAEEALIHLPDQERLIVIHEANGIENTDQLFANVFNESINLTHMSVFPVIPYRITDATSIDANGRFWVINTFYTGEVFLKVKKDNVLEHYQVNKGETHAKVEFVERLIELQYLHGHITFTDSKPIQLELDMQKKKVHNWEGIVRFDEKTFLVISDEYPYTKLAFVEIPGKGKK
ncbi:MAG: hypothetical protein AAF502_11285 [Bacteroidota bacterium]